jgi:dipeptidyl aminopeptidase/acylaminoacyl peptidase
LTIADLSARVYGVGELVIHEVLAENSYFTRYLVSYPSDGLTIYGFMNVPVRGLSPFPVVIAIHGYIEPQDYQTLDYTTGYADTLARAGFLVIHPNLRGYAPSDDGPNLFRVGMATDVLNLIALVKAGAGQPGPLEQARGDAIGLWGHSMGGGISIRVLTVSPDVKATVLYGAMSGDERRNYEAIQRWSNGERGNEELEVPETDLLRISPIYYLERIQAAVSIHHGEADLTVPIAWSLELCQTLQELGKSVECFTYPGQPHTFDATGSETFMQRVVAFYDQWLRP